jgi:hypothetical protein
MAAKQKPEELMAAAIALQRPAVQNQAVHLKVAN